MIKVWNLNRSSRRSSASRARCFASPSATLAALQAIDDMSDRLDRLMPLLEQIDGGMNTAGTGFDLAALGISTAASGLEQAVGILNASLPLFSESASAMRAVTERRQHHRL